MTAARRLTSLQMAGFVADGALRFDGIVPRALGDAALAELAGGGPPSPFGADPASPAAGWSGRPLAGLFRDWPALTAVLELPAVAAVIESLLGPDPIYDHHYAHVIAPRNEWSQPWHADAILDPRRAAFDIQLCFFFHDTPREMGGTMYLPGSHLRRVNEFAIARYQNFTAQEAMACPAGSLLVCHHGIWHCGQPNRTDSSRTMFKLRLNPRVAQRLVWDTADLRDPRIGKVLSRDHGWYGHEVRLEIANRIRLWRELTGDARYDVDFWLTRIENDPLAGTSKPG
jgi:Phytanoyl-CoA dioxygenase (PhyH)